MQISITDAKGRLNELVRRAEAGDEIVLTRDGQAVVRLVSVKTISRTQGRRMLLEAARVRSRQSERRTDRREKPRLPLW